MNADIVSRSTVWGRAVLAVWLLSLLSWCIIVAWILSGGCACDLHTPLFGDISYLSAVTTGMATFFLSFVSMFAYLAWWWRSS
ncbi:MAG: hypothetical protein GXX95_03105 [Methanomassiliicoccus sp.]|nr:hypothetical protein [Methanomassiliicoccus sp.]